VARIGHLQTLSLMGMRQYFIFTIIIALNLEGQAQIDTSLLTKNIYAAEDSMVAISKRKDWNAYADYMHPVVIEMSGGKEGFIQILESQPEILDSVQLYKVGKIFQLSKTGNQYQCIVEAFIQMKINGQVASGSSYDIAISEDGKKWIFFRIPPTVTSDQIKELLPGLNPDFKFPRSQTEVGKSLDEFMAGYAVEYLD
jgi:hypothetical protein